MNILLIFIISEIIFALNIGILYIVFNKRISKLENSLQNIHKRIDSIFTVDSATPNEVTKKGIGLEELGEQNMLNIPSDVKFQVEGMDNIPLGYEGKTN